MIPGGTSKCRESDSIVSDESNLVWRDGRRMLELGVLAEGLGQCDSSDCDKVLDLRNTESESRSGLGSLLWVRCTCGELNRVQTGKSHREKDKGPPIYNI